VQATDNRQIEVRSFLGQPITCACVAEWLGRGLQIRFMQVRILSRTPVMEETPQGEVAVCKTVAETHG
jgi:hypothetical protein